MKNQISHSPSPWLVQLVLALALAAHLPAATLTWLGGNGNWIEGQATHWAGGATWHDNDSAVFHSTPGTVTVSGAPVFVSANNVSLIDGYIFTGNNVELVAQSLRFVSPGSSTLTLKDQFVLAVTGADGINGGTFHVQDSSFLSAGVTNAITGGTINLSQNGTLEVEGAQGTGKNVTVNFDSSAGGEGGRILVKNVTSTVGHISSTGPAPAGVIESEGGSSHLVTDFDSGTSTFSGVIRNGAGTMALTKAGSGDLILTGTTNSYTGGTTLSGGYLVISHEQALGNAGSTVTFDGGNLRTQAGLGLIHAFNVAAGGGVIDTTGHDLAIFSLAGTGSLTKVGAGHFTLIAPESTFAGTLTIGGGTFELAPGKTLHLGTGGTGGAINGNMINNGTVVFNRSDAYSYTGVISGTGGITKEGGGTLTLSATSSFSGPITLKEGSLALASAEAIGTTGKIFFQNGMLQYSAANTVDYSPRFDRLNRQAYRFDTNGQVVNVSAELQNALSTLEKRGEGDLSLNASNLFGGGMNLVGGRLVLNNKWALGSAADPGPIEFNGGTLHWNPLYQEPLTDYSGRFSTKAGQVFRLSNTFSNDPNYSSIVTLTGNLSSVGGSLEKTGSGIIKLTGNNTYNGGTFLRAGTLQINGDANIGTGGITLDGGTLQVLNSGTLSTARDLHITSRAGTVNAGSVHVWNLTGDAGGTANILGNLTIANTCTVYGSVNPLSLDLQSGASLHVGNGTTGSLHVQNTTTVHGGVLTVDSAATTVLAGGLNGSGSLVKKGSGTLELLSTGNFSGTTFLNGGVIDLAAVGVLGTSPIQMDGGILRTSMPASIANTFNVLGGGGGVDTAGHDSTFNVITGTGAFHKTGLGQLMVVGASNIFNGHLSVDQGTFRVFQTATLQIGSGGSEGTLSGNVVNDGNIIFNRSASLTYGGVMSGSGTLQFQGPGVMAVTGANTRDGLTVIQNFVTIVSGTGRLGQNSAVRNDSQLIFNLDDGQTITNHISGTGMVSYDGMGTTLVTGSSSYTGGTELNFGVLKLGSAGALGSSGTIFMNGGTLAFSAANTTDYSGRFSNTQPQQFNIDTAGQNVRFDHDLNYTGSGGTTLTKLGAGTLTLGGSASFDGVTTIHEGTLRPLDQNLKSVVLTGSNATLDLAVPNGSVRHLTGVANTTVSGNHMHIQAGSFAGYVSGGVLFKDGIGELALSGSNAYDYTVLNGGTLLIENKDALSSGTITIALPSILATNVDVTLRDTQTVQIDWTDGTIDVRAGTFDIGKIQGDAQLFKIGAGKLVLNDASYDGSTFVHAGTLEIAEGHSLRSDLVSVDAGATFSLRDNAHYAGNVVGSGTFAYGGSDHTVFSGSSSSSVTTVVNSGTFVSYGDGTISGNVHNQGTLALDYNQDRTLAGVVSGTGVVLKQGSHTVTMSGSNTYTGATVVNGGTLRQAGSTASSSFAVASGAVLDLNVVTGLHNNDHNAVFTGSGTLLKTGTGGVVWGQAAATFNLSAGALIDVQEGTFTGGSNANEVWVDNKSGLNVAAGAHFAAVEANVRVDALTGSGTISSGFNGSNTFTFGVANGSGIFAGVLANNPVGNGLGNFAKSGTGTQILTGANTYTGTTTITGGILQIGAGGTTGGLASSTIVNNATLAFNRSDASSYDGTIRGNGRVTKSGNGALTLSGTNTYIGGTIISSGTLVARNNNALGGGSVIVESGGLLVDSGFTIANPVYLTGGSYDRVFSGGASLVNAINATSSLAGGQPDTTAQILGGTLTATGTLSSSFADTSSALNDEVRLSDVYSFHGTGTDIFVLQLSMTGVGPGSFLGWLNSSNQWVNAVFGNNGGTPFFIDGAYDGNLVLGHFGVDTATGSVWAVVNHNSDFSIVPEPSTWTLMALGSVMVLLLRRRWWERG